MKFAVQLYSLREEITQNGMASVLKKIKAAGFDGVELAGYFDFTPEQMKATLDELGLVAMGAHFGMDILSDCEELARVQQLFHFPTVTLPWVAEEDFDRLGEKIAPVLRNAISVLGEGVEVCYHNHAHEFHGGRDFIREVLSAVPESKAEVDIFWLKAAGKEVVPYLQSIAPRVAVLHVKEMGAGGVEDFNPVVGEGISDSQSALQWSKTRGLSWAVLEAERFEGDSLDYLTACAHAMRALAK